MKMLCCNYLLQFLSWCFYFITVKFWYIFLLNFYIGFAKNTISTGLVHTFIYDIAIVLKPIQFGGGFRPIPP